jgi:hypothetical protein
MELELEQGLDITTQRELNNIQIDHQDDVVTLI